MVGKTYDRGATSLGLSLSSIFTKYTPNESCRRIKLDFFNFWSSTDCKTGITS